MTMIDWREVVRLNPKGYAELNNGQRIVQGPIKEVIINYFGNVEIRLHWSARRKLDVRGLPEGDWEAISSRPVLGYTCPNFKVPYEIEESRGKGLRVRFAGDNVLYVDGVTGVGPKEVRGLNLPPG